MSVAVAVTVKAMGVTMSVLCGGHGNFFRGVLALSANSKHRQVRYVDGESVALFDLLSYVAHHRGVEFQDFLAAAAAQMAVLVSRILEREADEVGARNHLLGQARVGQRLQGSVNGAYVESRQAILGDGEDFLSGQMMVPANLGEDLEDDRPLCGYANAIVAQQIQDCLIHNLQIIAVKTSLRNGARACEAEFPLLSCQTVPTYLDYAATAPVRPELRQVLDQLYAQPLGNPSSLHRAGHRARMLLEHAREDCARLLGAEVEEIIFTSGATEANNLALAGWMRQQPRGSRLLVSAIEHPSVYDCAKALELEGYIIETIPVDTQGIIDIEELIARLDASCALVSVMAVNNEVGVCQPIEALAQALRALRLPNLRLHVDAVQAAVVVGLPALANIDFLSLSGHKLGAPVGCGLLYVRQGLRVAPLFVGGSQEDSRRAGTSNVAGAVALAQALKLADAERAPNQERMSELLAFLESELRQIPDAHLLGGQAPRSPHISSWFFEGVPAESLLVRLDMAGIYASSGSACSSHSLEPSRIVSAMGYSDAQSRGLIRFSLGPTSTRADVEAVTSALPGFIAQIRQAAGLLTTRTQPSNIGEL